MLKSLCRSFSLLLALSMLSPFAQDASALAPESKPSYKSGFSSQKPAPSYKSGSSSGGKPGGFGSFSGQRSAPPPAMPAPSRAGSRDGTRDGGFGSFSSAPADRGYRSDSASSRQLTRRQAEENALRTLEERRAREASRAAERDMARDPYRNGDRNTDRNTDRYGNRDSRSASDYGYGAPPPAQRPDIVRQGGGGLGNVVTGAIIAGAINSHANANNRQPAPAPAPVPNATGTGNDWGLGPRDGNHAGDTGSAGPAGNTGNVPTSSATVNQAPTGGGAFARVVLWLFLLALILAALMIWRRLRRRRREAEKPNYSFERN